MPSTHILIISSDSCPINLSKESRTKNAIIQKQPFITLIPKFPKPSIFSKKNARNKGIAMALGEFILPLDADDVIQPEYMRRMFAAGAMDFDDLIFFTVQLLQEHEDARTYWQRRRQYLQDDPADKAPALQYSR